MVHKSALWPSSQRLLQAKIELKIAAGRGSKNAAAQGQLEMLPAGRTCSQPVGHLVD